MSDDDFLVAGTAGLFAASKSRSYRENVKESFRVFVSFLQENELTTRKILAADEQVTDQLKIFKSDLTSVGFQVVKVAFYKWLNAQDKGMNISDVTILQKALDKIRSEE